MSLLKSDYDERMTLEDFEELLLNKPADEKWELINGWMLRGMVGAVVEHHIIISNIELALTTHFKAKGMPCRAFRETFYLKKKRDELAALPDIMVRCGPIERGATSIEDPLVLIEVVSPGSEGKDRATKRAAYQRLESVQHFILVSRDKAVIDHYIRSPEGWRGEPLLEGLDGTLVIAGLDFSMPVAAIYRDAEPVA